MLSEADLPAAQRGMKSEPREERPGRRGRCLGTRGCWCRRFVRVRQSSAQEALRPGWLRKGLQPGSEGGRIPSRRDSVHAERDAGDRVRPRPASHRAGPGGAGGRPGHGGDNEMERNEAGPGPKPGVAGPAGGAAGPSGVTALAFRRAPGGLRLPWRDLGSSIDFPDLISV